MREKFIKWYFAKAFRISPREYDLISCDDADMLMLINNAVNEKDLKDSEAEANRAKSRMRR